MKNISLKYMTQRSTLFVLIVASLLCSVKVFSQSKDSTGTDPNLTKVVHVVTEYEPSISDANRLAGMPEMSDTQTVKPVFKYSIISKPVNKYFEVTPITAAKMKAEPLGRLYRGLFTGGLGNYMSTLANLSLASIRSKKAMIATEFNHQGSFMDVKVNDIKQPSTVSNNSLKISGKRFLDKKEVYGSVTSSYDMFHAYGFPSTIKTIQDAGKIKNTYTGFAIQSGIRTQYIDSGQFNFDINPHFSFFDGNGNSEINAGVSNRFEKLFKTETVVADFNIDYYGASGDNVAGFQLNPNGNVRNGNLKAKVGFATQMYVGDIQKFHLYPDMYVEYNVAENVFIPFLGFNGFSRWSGFEQLAHENPYIQRGLSTTPENHKININGGFKGLISQTLPYQLSGNYSRVDGMHLYVTGNVPLQNTYTVLIDTADVINFHTEIGYKKLEKLNITFKFEYFKYAMLHQSSAWQKPEVITTLNLLWNLQNKILFSMDLFYVSDRQAYNLYTSTKSLASAFVDANLGVEYRYTKRISAFANINNIASQNYQYWNNTPVQRLNAMFGFSYAFWGE